MQIRLWLYVEENVLLRACCIFAYNLLCVFLQVDYKIAQSVFYLYTVCLMVLLEDMTTFFILLKLNFAPE